MTPYEALYGRKCQTAVCWEKGRGYAVIWVGIGAGYLRKDKNHKRQDARSL